MVLFAFDVKAEAFLAGLSDLLLQACAPVPTISAFFSMQMPP